MINPVFVGPKPEGGTGELLAKADVGAIQSSLVSAAPGEVILFSLVFRRSADPVDRDSAKPVHVLVKNALVEVRSAVKYRESYRGLVSLFLEPGLKKYSALKTHSLNVGRMARKFATHLGLGPSAIEQLTVAGILHDVGMRELNYDEIYGKRTLNENEIRLVRQHPKLGAFLLEGVSWPYPIAPLVKHHHERWDGGGYPDGLRAEEIPFGSRIIHLCETFDAMTSPSSYRQIYAMGQALEIIASKRGTQFDPELTPAFVQLAESLEA
jgi:HD-GYP domain-containing protein (c-di-GMP phosphodiesterase class II)